MERGLGIVPNGVCLSNLIRVLSRGCVGEASKIMLKLVYVVRCGGWIGRWDRTGYRYFCVIRKRIFCSCLKRGELDKLEAWAAAGEAKVREWCQQRQWRSARRARGRKQYTSVDEVRKECEAGERSVCFLCVCTRRMSDRYGACHRTPGIGRFCVQQRLRVLGD